MKKFAAFVLLLSAGMFTLGCDKPKDKGPAAPEGDAPAADAPADGAEEAK